MNQDRIDSVVRAAIAQGLLPAGATRPNTDSRPWPVVLLTGLGAWLAALPLLGVVGLLFGDLLSRRVGPYIVGVGLLTAAIVVLRSRALPLFVEQLAIPALLVGGGALGFGLFRDLQAQAGSALLALVTLALAVAIPRPWLRALLGAGAALLMTLAWLPARWGVDSGDPLLRFWLAWHLCLALWWLATWVQRRWLNDGALGAQAAALESTAAGWLLATLAGLALWSGMSFLIGGSLGGGGVGALARELGTRRTGGVSNVLPQATSALLALGAAGWAARHWPSLRRAWAAAAALVLVALAWFMPALGAVLLAGACCMTSARWRLAASAALAAAWIVGAFYYQLSWPLASKALLLAATGALLAALAWFGRRGGDPARPARHAATGTAAGAGAATGARAMAWRGGVGLGVLATLLVANLGIWQKETLIARGQALFVELAPVDPRSLMQGDFMRLNFRLPADVEARATQLPGSQRPQVVARRDARGVASLLRLDAGDPLAADELRVELTPRGGRWTLVTDAWFFKEGQAQRWAKARYGEFRVDGNGRALLVGLRGAGLEAL